MPPELVFSKFKTYFNFHKFKVGTKFFHFDSKKREYLLQKLAPRTFFFRSSTVLKSDLKSNAQLKTSSHVNGRQSKDMRTSRRSTSLLLLCSLNIWCSIPLTHTFSIISSRNSRYCFLISTCCFIFIPRICECRITVNFHSINTDVIFILVYLFMEHIPNLKFLISSTVNNTLSILIMLTCYLPNIGYKEEQFHVIIQYN